MRKDLLILLVLVAVGAGIGGNHYLQYLEEKRADEARAEKHRQVQLANQRKRDAEKRLREQQDVLVGQARVLINEWSGRGDGLQKAHAILQEVLLANPRHAKAHVEMARYVLNSGYINYRNFAPGTLDKAIYELHLAKLADPEDGDIDVLLAHVLNLRYASKDAIKALEKVESRAKGNPWLYLNWAQALMDLRRWSEAEARLNQASEQYAKNVPGRHVLRSFHEKKSEVFERQGKLEEADKEYQKLFAIDPNDAWTHGNYATFLLFRRADPDAAIAEAERALELMNYGMARQVLAAAHYAKWAQLKRSHPVQAKQYLARAQKGASGFHWIMPQAAKSVDAGPPIQRMVAELAALGVSIDTRDENGDTGLTLAAHIGRLVSVRYLLKLGANIEAADNFGRTGLALAADTGSKDIVGLLAAHGANLNVQDKTGYAPIFFAVNNEDREMVEMLVALKAKINQSAIGGYTALMLAASLGNMEIARILLNAGADPDMVTTESRMSAAALAESGGHLELAELIRQHKRTSGK